ncbi:MAG: hypothetical protein JWQ88_3921 [Rhodoferax sp.]|nr:hypothetical protein [Rhodoferax sp.]
MSTTRSTTTNSTAPLEIDDGSHPARDASDVGGIPATLQHGLTNDDQDTGATPIGQPTDADWANREAAAKGDHDPDAGQATTHHGAAERREPGHIDSALESLGEAITDPIREASEQMSNDSGGRPASEPERRT